MSRKSRQLAADFLAYLPMKDKEDLFSKLKKLAQTYIQALQVFDELATSEQK